MTYSLSHVTFSVWCTIEGVRSVKTKAKELVLVSLLDFHLGFVQSFRTKGYPDIFYLAFCFFFVTETVFLIIRRNSPIILLYTFPTICPRTGKSIINVSTLKFVRKT